MNLDSSDCIIFMRNTKFLYYDYHYDYFRWERGTKHKHRMQKRNSSSVCETEWKKEIKSIRSTTDCQTYPNKNTNTTINEHVNTDKYMQTEKLTKWTWTYVADL